MSDLSSDLNWTKVNNGESLRRRSERELSLGSYFLDANEEPFSKVISYDGKIMG